MYSVFSTCCPQYLPTKRKHIQMGRHWGRGPLKTPMDFSVSPYIWQFHLASSFCYQLHYSCNRSDPGVSLCSGGVHCPADGLLAQRQHLPTQSACLEHPTLRSVVPGLLILPRQYLFCVPEEGRFRKGILSE